jgi:Uma2 family endonuclease
MSATAMPNATASAGTTTPPPAATGPRPWKWTRDDLLRCHELGMFGDRRVMLIDGEVLAMSPMNEPHARAIVFVLDALQAAFGTNFTFRPQLPMDLGQTTDPEPDVIVVAGPPRSQPTTPPSTAALVVEVADSSLAFDIAEKASLYAAAGIADYWVLDIAHNRLYVFRDPRPEAGQRFGHGYFRQSLNGPTDRVSPLAAPAASILVSDLLP